MGETVTINDKKKALELVLGLDPTQHSINVNGARWDLVKSVEVSMEAENPHETLIKFACYLDDPQDFVGTLALKDRTHIAVQLRLDGPGSRCTFDGKQIRFTNARLYADAQSVTTLEIEQTYPISNTVKGVFVPSGEQKIESFPPFE